MILAKTVAESFVVFVLKLKFSNRLLRPVLFINSRTHSVYKHSAEHCILYNTVQTYRVLNVGRMFVNKASQR